MDNPENSDADFSPVNDPSRKPNKKLQALLLILVGVPVVTGLIFFLTDDQWTFKVARPLNSEPSLDNQTTVESEDLPVQPNIEPVMFSDEPGVKNGRFYTADEVVIPDVTMIIGVEVDGQFRAYMPGGMNSIDQHILHDDFNGQPITMTYCDKSDCARAFIRGDLDPNQIRMGGFSGKAMWLLINQQRFVQHDTEAPMEDYPLTRMTWKCWKTLHPETTIYVGIGLAYAQTLRDGDDELPQDAFDRD